VPRPRKRRRIRRKQLAAIYKPVGIALDDLERVPLLPEELEALRLADLEGLSQFEGAESMGISRSTFQRIVANARRQVTLALVEGRALVLEGSRLESGPPRPRRQKQVRDKNSHG
jgi:predicted DNA-binding protein (UPF0251 family)